MLEYLSRYLGDLWAAINWVAANRRKVPRAKCLTRARRWDRGAWLLG